jgi:3-deoxy-manno-octulosonate cytidylyltransferase (CMP-KDO synthetase)
VIDQVAALLRDEPDAGMATLAEPITRADDVMDPNFVKLVTDVTGRALYFSRAPLPWSRDDFPPAAGSTLGAGTWRRHLGIYAYRAGLLHDFVRWSPAPLEQVEMLEQLRVLHQGVPIRVADACAPVPGGVDTPADLERVRAWIAD